MDEDAAAAEIQEAAASYLEKKRADAAAPVPAPADGGLLEGIIGMFSNRPPAAATFAAPTPTSTVAAPASAPVAAPAAVVPVVAPDVAPAAEPATAATAPA